jgi:hypothetical protein
MLARAYRSTLAERRSTLDGRPMMRRRVFPAALTIAAAVLVTGCVTSRPGIPTPETAEVLPADARALRYGATGPEVLDNPQLRDALRRLFGPDWTPGPGRTFGAAAFFPASASIRMLRVGDHDYIAVSGCVPSACEGHRGLLLIGADEHLLARLDDGGFAHYYEYGPGATGGVRSRTILDGAWLALEGAHRG